MPHKPKTFKPRWMQTATKQSRTVARKRYDAERGNYRQRGYGTSWDKFKAWLKTQPEFAVCATPQCSLPVYAIDHIEAMSGPEDTRFLDIANLQPLCRSCHARKTIKHDGGYGHKPNQSREAKAELQQMLRDAAVRAEAIEARGI